MITREQKHSSKQKQICEAISNNDTATAWKIVGHMGAGSLYGSRGTMDIEDWQKGIGKREHANAGVVQHHVVRVLVGRGEQVCNPLRIGRVVVLRQAADTGPARVNADDSMIRSSGI